MASLPRLRIAQREIFLMRAHGGLQNFRRHIHELVFDGADQHHRPFGQARHFVQQPLVLDQFEAQRESLLLRVVQDDLLALGGVEHHMRGAQLLVIIVEAAHLDLACRQETDVRASCCPLVTPANANGTTSPSKVQRMECSGRTQRTATAVERQRMDFGQGSLAIAFRQNLRQNFGGLAALALDHRDIEFALAVVSLLALFQRHARRAQKSLDRFFRRVDARAFLFFASHRAACGQARHRQRQPARPGERLDAFEQQAAIRQRADHQPLQILRRLRLHARGDFFGEKFGADQAWTPPPGTTSPTSPQGGG